MTRNTERTILRIQGKLYKIGDILYIPDLKCNGTILRFLRDFVVLQPHTYGIPVRRMARNLIIERQLTLSAKYQLQTR